jgi:predicted PurR-regulated permease PerM
MTKILFDKKYRVTLVLILIIGVLLLYVFIVFPLFIKWQDIDKEVMGQKTRFLKQRALLEHIDDYKAVYTRYQNELQISGDQEQIATLFLKDLESLVKSAGLMIVDIKVLPKLYEKDAVRFLVEVEMEAEIAQLVELLHLMATTDKLITAERLTVERKSAQEQTLSIRALFSLIKTA